MGGVFVVRSAGLQQPAVPADGLVGRRLLAVLGPGDVGVLPRAAHVLLDHHVRRHPNGAAIADFAHLLPAQVHHARHFLDRRSRHLHVDRTQPNSLAGRRRVRATRVFGVLHHHDPAARHLPLLALLRRLPRHLLAQRHALPQSAPQVLRRLHSPRSHRCHRRRHLRRFGPHLQQRRAVPLLHLPPQSLRLHPRLRLLPLQGRHRTRQELRHGHPPGPRRVHR